MSRSAPSLSRNVLWNLFGQVAPLFAAVVAIPILIKGIGVDRFGLLTLAWMVIGYFSLFDFGLGRALIKLVSEKLGEGREDLIPALVWTALILMTGIGVVGGLVLFAATDWLVGTVIKVPTFLTDEATKSFILLACSVPAVILTTGLRGVLEAYRRFDLVNLARLPLGVLMFAAPVAALPFSNRLDVIIAILLAVRIVLTVVHVILCDKVVPGLFRKASFSRQLIRPLLVFGGWMTISNIVSPIMVYMDRFFISNSLGLTAVAYYATPYELITKLLVIPGAYVGVLFPTFSASLSSDGATANKLFIQSIAFLFILLFPVVLISTVFASEGLGIWLSAEFSMNGTSVLQWLSAGVFLNSLAQVPFAFIQSAGRPDLTAKLHLVELPFYIAILWMLSQHFGIAGVAAAWTFRIFTDAVLMFLVATKLQRNPIGGLKKIAAALLAALLVLFFGSTFQALPAKVGFCLVIIPISFVVALRLLLSDNDRTIIRRNLRRFTR